MTPSHFLASDVCRHLLCGVCIFSATFGAPRVGHAAPGFEVESLKVCVNYAKTLNECKSPQQDQNIFLERSVFANHYVYAVASVKFDSTSVDFMQDFHYFPINAQIFCDSDRKKPIAIGVSQDRWETSGRILEAKVQANGYFAFETYFNMPLYSYKKIEISIVDENGIVARMQSGVARLTINFSR